MKYVLFVALSFSLFVTPVTVRGNLQEPIVNEPAEIIEGEDLPRFIVVQGFFSYAEAMRGVGGKVYREFLLKIGLTPDTIGQQFLETALDQAALLAQEPISDPSLAEDREAFRADQRERSLSIASRYGRVYGELLTSLATGGMPIPGFEAVIDLLIRPTISIALYADDEIELHDGKTRHSELDAAFVQALQEAYDGSSI